MLQQGSARTESDPRELILTDSDVERLRLFIAVCRSLCENHFKEVNLTQKSIAVRTDRGPVLYRLNETREIPIASDGDVKAQTYELIHVQDWDVFLFVGISDTRRVVVGRRDSNQQVKGQYLPDFEELRSGNPNVPTIRRLVANAISVLESPGALTPPRPDTPLEERRVMIYPPFLPPGTDTSKK